MDRACGTRYRLVLGAAGGLRDGARQVISTVNRMGTPLLGRQSDGYPCDYIQSEGVPMRLTVETVSTMVQLFIVRFEFRLVNYYETT